MTSQKAQIQFSSLVEAMTIREMVAVVRWVLKDQADPVIGLCVPESEYPDVGKRLDYMFWVKVGSMSHYRARVDTQLPFAEDEHNFWFPSLTTYKTSAGKFITEHPLLPTDEQCELMDELVDALDLDEYAQKLHDAEKEQRQRAAVEEEEGDEDMQEE
jgi:ATP-dependent DNA helicase 2 subunit 2